MFDIDKPDRQIEMFILDIFIAIQKINKVASKFNNVQDLLYSFTDWDSVRVACKKSLFAGNVEC
jgi:hypothetical protein